MSEIIQEFEKIERAIAESKKALTESYAEMIEFIGATIEASRHPITDPWVRSTVYRMNDGKCVYCAVAMKLFGTEADSFSVDHVVPKSLGGPDNIANYVPACRTCNSTKGDRHVLAMIATLTDLSRRMSGDDAS